MAYFTPQGFAKVNDEWERVSMKKYDERHGGPFDRGSADSYYNRPRSPHYYVGNTYSTECVAGMHLTKEDIEAYNAGYDYNEQFGDKKDWG